MAAAFAALRDQAYTDDYVSEVLRARDWIVSVMTRSSAVFHCDGGNYLLVWPERSAAEVEQALRAEGILVRSMAGKPQVDGSLRVSIGTLQQMQRFWKVFSFVSKSG